jgi:quercetin dioxygenase-like cupin family protein
VAGAIPIDSFRRSAHSAQFVGAAHGANVSFFVGTYPPGFRVGPHRHPYEETFVILEGELDFEVDGEPVPAGPGTVVVVPARAVHGFTVRSPTKQVNIHPVAEMTTEWLDDTVR